MDRSCRRAATARPGLVWPPVPPRRWRRLLPRPLFPVALERELDQTLEQLAVAEPGGLPHARVPARGGEPGDRVDLVHQNAVAVQEEVHARHAGAVDGTVGRDRQRADPPARLGRDRRRNRDPRPALGVLRRIVVEIAWVGDLAGQGGHGLVVAEDAHLALPATDGALDEELLAVARRLVECI